MNSPQIEILNFSQIRKYSYIFNLYCVKIVFITKTTEDIFMSRTEFLVR